MIQGVIFIVSYVDVARVCVFLLTLNVSTNKYDALHDNNNATALLDLR